ncbi:amino acid ABC transporter substrate-binding protein [Paenarthrobacter nitroguajacolicus]|uniref:Amino acid ABC transporter substrate-binding protein n=1 Tax=Paenarthrobacter nitroguajacolicus TaxID=211146 RepID=A0A558GNF9_PAENT|nr:MULTISPECIES: transporter substrate-binding domain-containing protein [Paenarthrobacter]MCM0616866.1 transporter substrate-binding domain-containing protein [Paenarthrobacter sp. TYUT067]TVU58378.1 amino acid ABC transporter substrate-binding protein [Paenarthrobacter nitroguajacolicus]
MTKTSKIVLAVLAVILVSIAGGYIGSGFRGSSASASTGAAQGNFIEEIKKRGELRVGVAIAPPMTVQEADGTLGGPNLIPLQELAKQLDVKLVPVAAEWKNIVAGLQANRYDFAANLDYTVERSLAIGFTDPVYQYQGVFVVRADSPFKTAEDIIANGGQIATAQGSAPEKALQGHTSTIMSVDSYSNAISGVQSGRVIAEFTDLPTAESQAQADSSLKIVVPSPEIYSASAAYGVPSTIDPRSLQIVNVAIERAQKSGELTQAYAKVNYVEIDNLGDLLKK